MPIRMVNVVEFAHVLRLLDGLASPAVVDRALREAGIRRNIVKEPGFLPYEIEAVVLESVARALGEHHLGARLGQAFDYLAYGAYARYVLGAHDLADAIVRSRRALPLILPGSDVVPRRSGDHLILGRASPIQSVVGSRHLDEGTVFVIGKALRHFLGPDWLPDWIEVVADRPAGVASIEEMAGTSVRTGAPMPAVAIRLSDLNAPNPRPLDPEGAVTLSELPLLMGVTPPKTTRDVVRQVLRSQLALGDFSEDSVSRRLLVGPRTLQRTLNSEGTSFREVRTQFLQERACALLAESSLPIDDIARSLGYSEPASFRRAFRNWTGLSPSAYRTHARGRTSAPD